MNAPDAKERAALEQDLSALRAEVDKAKGLISALVKELTEALELAKARRAALE